MLRDLLVRLKRDDDVCASSAASAFTISRSRLRDVGVALVLEERQREGNVVGGDRRAVVEARLGAEEESAARCGRRTSPPSSATRP